MCKRVRPPVSEAVWMQMRRRLSSGMATSRPTRVLGNCRCGLDLWAKSEVARSPAPEVLFMTLPRNSVNLLVSHASAFRAFRSTTVCFQWLSHDFQRLLCTSHSTWWSTDISQENSTHRCCKEEQQEEKKTQGGEETHSSSYLMMRAFSAVVLSLQLSIFRRHQWHG